VQRKHPNITLAIAGELSFFPTDHARLDHLIGQLGLIGHVHKTGFVAAGDLPALYRRATALLQPSWFEGFGLTPLEAGACGCPSIISDRGSLPEIMGPAGLVVDPADPKAIAAGMTRMLERGARDSYARLSQERSRRFTWRATAARVNEIYHALLK
jgi:glycosyltransferase involved in cell wall biosynthesis